MTILEHTLGIFLHPDSEWKAICREQHSFIQVFMSHVPILTLIPTLAAYYGVTQVGWRIGEGSVVKLTADSAMYLCAFAYVATLAAIYIIGEYTNWMSRTFGVRDDAAHRHYEGTALAVYASVPMLLAGAVMAYPNIWLVAVVLLAAMSYSIYLLYEGTPILMNIPKEQAFIYSSSVVTVALVMAVVVMISTVIIWGMGINPVYIDA